ncbi:hypothetical protein HY251_12270 [bacterium]|nr:hypothetical protein [bacterium]
MEARRGPPWYAFAYRLLGAHGTFWLLLVAIVAMLWTWHGALVRIVDMDPEERTVADAASAHDFHRWFQLQGVRIALDDALLGAEAGAAPWFEPATILVDERDPAAAFWEKTQAASRAHATLVSLEPAQAALGSAAGLVSRLAERETVKAIERAYVTVKKGRETRSFQEVLPRPQSAILLLGDGAPVGSSVPALVGNGTRPAGDPPRPPDGGGGPAPGGDETEAYERDLVAWRDVVLARVSLASPRGLLDDAPPSLLERLEKAPGVRLASRALRVDRKPNDLELYAFGASALAFVFLAAGLYGVWGWQKELAGPET